jgi:1-acyl-sn-glycerol-3-phosphate acyltransferase
MVIPCALIGSQDIFPVGANLIAPGTVTVVYGAPITTDGLEENDQAVQMLSDQVRAWIVDQVEAPNRDSREAPIG